MKAPRQCLEFLNISLKLTFCGYEKKFEGPLVFFRLFVIEPNLFPRFQGNPDDCKDLLIIIDDCKDLLIGGVMMLKER